MNHPTATILLTTAFVSGACAQLGSGWSEYQPKWRVDVPPNAAAYGDRYTYEAGVYHLWVKSTDQSTFPGRDSGPRSEVRVLNEYQSGDRQFEADIMVAAGSEKVGIWQTWKTPTPWMIRVYGGKFLEWGGASTIGSVSFGKYQRFNAIHSTSTRKLDIYLDGQRIYSTTISNDIGTPFYNKFGVYGREGMGAMNEIRFKNVKFFAKGGTSAITLAPAGEGPGLAPVDRSAWREIDPLGRDAAGRNGIPRLILAGGRAALVP